MSIRLSKVGNISEALPYTTSSSYDFGSALTRILLLMLKFYPFFGGSLMGKRFRAYKMVLSVILVLRFLLLVVVPVLSGRILVTIFSLV